MLYKGCNKTSEQIESIFNIINQESGPVELDYVNHYTLLVAVVLSARQTDKGVNKATAELFKKVTTPQAMLELGVDNLMEYVKTLGLYKTKSKHIIELSQILIDKHNSEVPNDRDALEALPGVGRKTANVVLNEAFGAAVFPVDVHVFKVCNRLGLCDAKTPEQTEKALETLVPEPYRLNASSGLVLHGRYICTSRSPKCSQCKLQQYCDYYAVNKGSKLCK